MIGNIATRGCSVGEGSDELASQRESGDVGKEPRHNRCVSFTERRGCFSTLQTFPTCMSVMGIPLGQLSYQRALHSTSYLLRLERVIRLRRD